MSQATYLFTLECVGRCERSTEAAEHWLRVAANALTQAGFAMDDAQAIGIDGGPGASVDFPDPYPRRLQVAPQERAAHADFRGMGGEGARG